MCRVVKSPLSRTTGPYALPKVAGKAPEHIHNISPLTPLINEPCLEPAREATRHWETVGEHVLMLLNLGSRPPLRDPSDDHGCGQQSPAFAPVPARGT
jgi:hypothetical protein